MYHISKSINRAGENIGLKFCHFPSYNPTSNANLTILKQIIVNKLWCAHKFKKRFLPIATSLCGEAQTPSKLIDFQMNLSPTVAY